LRYRTVAWSSPRLGSVFADSRNKVQFPAPPPIFIEKRPLTPSFLTACHSLALGERDCLPPGAPTAHIVFYEKPGCAGNAKQRAALERAGQTLDRRNLTTAGWAATRLLEFFGRLPVQQFNRSAPRVKSGEVVLSRDHALALLAAEPILIPRP
jgi:arsenate reductase-like glutaredoxin family protein